MKGSLRKGRDERLNMGEDGRGLDRWRELNKKSEQTEMYPAPKEGSRGL